MESQSTVSQKICSVDACLRPVLAKSLCTSHYQKMKQYGSVAARARDWVHFWETDKLKAKFFRCIKVASPDECWIWNGAKKGGKLKYGAINIDGKNFMAHRLSAYLFKGFDIKSSNMICHRCDVPLCVNPSHLFEGSPLDNMLDKKSKGRATRLPGSQNPMAKVSEDDVITIRRLAAGGASHPELAASFGLSVPQVYAIVTRRNWRHV